MIKQPITLPPNRQWSQQNNGNIFGSVYSSRNVNFEVPGIVSLSRRMHPILRQVVSGAGTDLGRVLAVVYGEFGATRAGGSSTEQYIVVTDDELFVLSGLLTNIGVLTNAGGPIMSDYSDGISWNDGFYCTTTSNLSKLVSGTWTNSLMSLNSAEPHPLEKSASANYLLVGNDNVLKKRTTAGVNSDALTLPANYQIVWIRSDYSRTLIGARAIDGTNAAVFEWDEVSPTWTNKYDIDCTWPYSGCFRNTDFFVVTNDGRLLKFNGGGFSEAAQWPIHKALTGYWDGNETNLVSNPVYQRSMGVINGRLTINVSGGVEYGQYSAELYENFPSGIWDFSEETGLTHKWGQTVETDNSDYCHLRFASGGGAIAQVFVEDGPPDPTDGSVLLTGARLDGDADTAYYTVSTVISGGKNVGQITSTRIETSDIADDAKKIWCKYRGVFSADDKITFKYKDEWKNGLPFDTGNEYITWTSTTTFTSAFTYFQYASVGDEVTITSGPGAGLTMHISAISVASGTYTVTLDEANPTATNADTGYCIVDNFIKLTETITSADTQGYKEINIPQTNPHTWTQIKAELKGSEYVTIEELQLVPASDIIAQP